MLDLSKRCTDPTPQRHMALAESHSFNFFMFTLGLPHRCDFDLLKAL